MNNKTMNKEAMDKRSFLEEVKEKTVNKMSFQYTGKETRRIENKFKKCNANISFKIIIP